MALRNRSPRRSGGCWGDISIRGRDRAGPNRDARMAAPQPMTIDKGNVSRNRCLTSGIGGNLWRKTRLQHEGKLGCRGLGRVKCPRGFG